MVRPLAATALAAAALVATHQIPTAEAAGKSYQKGHKVELWVSKVRYQTIAEGANTKHARFLLFRWSFSAGNFRRIRYFWYRHDQRISGHKMCWSGRQRGENDEEERELRLVGIYSVRLPLTMVE